MSFGDFQRSRDETLTQRLRSAKATGNVPQWHVVGLAEVEMEVSPPTQPSIQSSKTSLPEKSKDNNGTSMAPWALAAGVVSLLVILVLAALMVAHRTKYAA